MKQKIEERRERLPRITEVAHHLLAGRVRPGDTVVDATAGNGYDTLFLAQLVGENGLVYAYDVQEQAVAATADRLATAGVEKQVRLYHASHTEIVHIKEEVQAVVFNLGYLPGSDKTMITQAESTLTAIQAAREKLVRGGMIVLVIYRGHDGGEEEAAQIEAYAQSLPITEYLVLRYDYINPDNRPPYIIAIEKK
ncbi:class I SAM-dependent methyltransferase [Aneurinibacillus uraniidurans]|uniref:class I SAM-dependent methyltransferase n=1 Tax=Aneurinibacillus uraniidurans TaxID=2966586 RepID=UPI002348F1C2|nr:class I SAM-dependent methyltransferase [Aneurinibacillus sp. B1]WCN36634.1 class I SAM-dependent methyltransferase [Aneurinibacillus sp. B1]